ncbi:MAG: thioesterase family protein [Neisseria sp.]|nr:thioesterase family protein [Neisseria sp.]
MPPIHSSIRVRGYHLDGYGHVNNARYLEFLEEARWAFFEQANLPIDANLQLIVADVHIRYRQAALNDDVLQIHCRVQEWNKRRIVLQQQIFLNQNPKVATEANIILLPAADGKSVSLPESLQNALARVMQQQTDLSINEKP